MQLPRGTFREIRKSVTIDSLLKELDGERFSGVASISSQSLTGTFVFKAGKCILVKFQKSRGDAGLDELQKARGEEVDAAISLLGDAQIELALEFNKPFRITRPGMHVPPPASQRPVVLPPSRETPRAPSQKPAVPGSPLQPHIKPSPSRIRVPPPQSAPAAHAHDPAQHPPPFTTTAAQTPPAPPMPVLGHDSTKAAEAEEQSAETKDTSFEDDLETFDTMDFDTVTDKIRTDCKTMIKQLHLDHLMER